MQKPQLLDIEKISIAFLGSYVPRECGIATYTKDLIHSMSELKAFRSPSVIAINEPGAIHHYGRRVRFQINQNLIDDYVQAAEYVNGSRIQAISLQHEFGLYGGEWGSHILSFLENVEKPVVTTLHTVEPNFPQNAQDVIRQIIKNSTSVVVMAHAAKEMLSNYGASARKISVIEHGCPDIPFVDSETVKSSLGLEGRRVLSTFGLISQGKGIEYAIRALPSIVDVDPSVVYVIIGETHPVIRSTQGERYRIKLIKLVEELEMTEHVFFANRFLRKNELSKFLQATDVYITPYISPNQISSGTLAYAIGAGRAVVSTPYLHAKEALADGRGLFCKFKDPKSIAEQVKKLLLNEKLRKSMEKKAYKYSRRFIWPNVGKRYGRVFEKVI